MSLDQRDYKLFGKEWRINWIEKKFYIMHGHLVGSNQEHWDMAVIENHDKKAIHYHCRLVACNTKVPAGIVTVALTKGLNEAIKS